MCQTGLCDGDRASFPSFGHPSPAGQAHIFGGCQGLRVHLDPLFMSTFFDYRGNLPSNRMANWLRILAQLAMGMDHFFWMLACAR